MTCIAAVETDGGVWVAWDARLSGEVADACRTKVRLYDGGVLVGIAGDAAVGQRLLFRDGLLPPAGNDVEAWAHRSVLSWRGEVPDDVWVLVAARGVVVTVHPDGYVHRSAYGYGAVGSGAPFALGSLASTDSRSRDAVLGAVMAACRHSPYCGAPIDAVWVPS